MGGGGGDLRQLQLATLGRQAAAAVQAALGGGPVVQRTDDYRIGTLRQEAKAAIKTTLLEIDALVAELIAAAE